MIQLIFQSPPQCDSKVSLQHHFSLVGLFEFPPMSYALFKPLDLYAVAFLDLPMLML